MGAKMKFGSHIATNGVKVLFSETTFKISKEKTKTNAKAIPRAKLRPKPPRFFSEAKDSPKNVRIITETGIEVLW